MTQPSPAGPLREARSDNAVDWLGFRGALNDAQLWPESLIFMRMFDGSGAP
jgi:hypothetical protein